MRCCLPRGHWQTEARQTHGQAQPVKLESRLLPTQLSLSGAPLASDLSSAQAQASNPGLRLWVARAADRAGPARENTNAASALPVNASDSESDHWHHEHDCNRRQRDRVCFFVLCKRHWINRVYMYVYYCRTYEKAVSGGGEREKGGHVLRDTTSRGLCVRDWPPHTSERRGGRQASSR